METLVSLDKSNLCAKRKKKHFIGVKVHASLQHTKHVSNMSVSDVWRLDVPDPPHETGNGVMMIHR